MAYFDDIFQCNKCGFCQTECPIFRSTGHEAGVARGRLSLLRAVIEGRLSWSKELEAPLFNCLLCGACTSNCFPKIPTADLMADARAQYLEKVGKKPVHRLLFDHLLPYPKRLHVAARAAAVGKNSGISDVIRALGLLRFLGQDFQQAEDIIARMPVRPFREKFKPGKYRGEGKTQAIGYFVGCGSDVIAHASAEATFQMLRKIGKSVTLLDNCCCGLPAWSYGDMQAAGKMAQRNLKILMSQKFNLVVTDCSSCANFLKKYPRLFSDNSRQKEAAADISHRIRDMAELKAEADGPGPSLESPLRVTYHDPCHASRGQGLTKAPRQMLQNLPGVAYEEMPEAHWCCGGAGSYALSNYDLSRKVLDRKMKNLQKTRAQVLVTSCPACIIHLSYGIRKHGLKTRVCHLSEIVNRFAPTAAVSF